MWLHSSVGRASHRYRGGHGFESRWSPDFFQASTFQLLNWKIYCDDHSSLSLHEVLFKLVTCKMIVGFYLYFMSWIKHVLLYSWRFSRYSAPTHWLVHGHMTSNNKTVSRQMPWAGNIAKTMTSNGKQFTVTRENVDRFCWNLSALLKICFRIVLLYNKSLKDWSLGEQWILFPSNLNVSLDFVSGNIEILGKQNSLFPSGPVIKCLLFTQDYFYTRGGGGGGGGTWVNFCWLCAAGLSEPLPHYNLFWRYDWSSQPCKQLKQLWN